MRADTTMPRVISAQSIMFSSEDLGMKRGRGGLGREVERPEHLLQIEIATGRQFWRARDLFQLGKRVMLSVHPQKLLTDDLMKTVCLRGKTGETVVNGTNRVDAGRTTSINGTS